jgi:2-polyprenyl-3-methyl-5-hydroxy-6-metoxy-1,4-benzoquinol methylase
MDRWLWLNTQLSSNSGNKLLDLGCGSGAFTIGAGRIGYQSIGINWNDKELGVAKRRIEILRSANVGFEKFDIRQLDFRSDFYNKFDVVLCIETIEHIIDDQKLIRDISNCLLDGGRVILTTPNFHYKAITKGDDGPFLPIEDGRHVRRGYTRETLIRLCEDSGLQVIQISYLSGFLSQIITKIQRIFSELHPLIGWTIILPVRFLPPILDDWITRKLRWPFFSIGIVAKKGFRL